MLFYYHMTIGDIETWLKGMGLNFGHSTVMGWIETVKDVEDDGPMFNDMKSYFDNLAKNLENEEGCSKIFVEMKIQSVKCSDCGIHALFIFSLIL